MFFVAEIIPINPSSVDNELERQQPVLDGSENSSKAGCVETTTYDNEGEIVRSVIRKKKYLNGSGFVISYTAKMLDFIANTRQGATVRVFLYLAHNQNYGTDDKTFGYRCSHKYLQQILGLDKKSIYNAITYLKDNFLIVETREDGQSEFMVNPNYVTIGQDKKRRMGIWNARWAKVMQARGVKDLQVPKSK